VSPSEVDVVVPTVGRPSLRLMLEALDRAGGGAARSLVLVDDRGGGGPPLADQVPAGLAGGIRVLPGRGAGPAAARNIGWRVGDAPWVAFLDDDVEPPADWWDLLLEDLADCGPGVAASQGRIEVPLPQGRPPTDWERNVAGLEVARWATADMAYRRPVLEAVGGFDERFPRAYREDADLGLRVVDGGRRIVTGQRRVVHPVRPAPWHVSVGKQAGNADDALMRRLHGGDWRYRAHAPPGGFRRHAAVSAALGVGAVGVLLGRRRVAVAGLAAWAAGTARFAAARIAPGPRTVDEVGAMVLTSLAIPPAAVWWRLRGEVASRGLGPADRRRGRASETRHPRPIGDAPARPSGRPAAVLFDRDGTLVVDVPYNGDPSRVELVPGARGAVDRLRHAGVVVGLVSNQSGVARGLLDRAQVDAVNERVAELVGGFDTVQVCPHGPDDGCGCRKPGPGMVLAACSELGIDPSACVVIGDIGADVAAAAAAGARGILVPTPVTRPAEVDSAAEVVANLSAAVDLLLRAPGPARGQSLLTPVRTPDAELVL
jgi:HAD superfamily hydrolase (TIGR01662 family)